jgi:hypothetical protein
MPQMTIEFDQATDDQLEELKEFFGVKTKAAVIRRALAIANVAKSNADGDKSVTFVKPNTLEREKLMLAA